MRVLLGLYEGCIGIILRLYEVILGLYCEFGC